MANSYQKTTPTNNANSSNQVDFGQVQLQSDEQRAQEALETILPICGEDKIRQTIANENEDY